MTNFFLKNDLQEICNKSSLLGKYFEGKTILITGGRGFLGRNFIEVFNYLNENYFSKPAELIILDNFISSGDQGREIPKYKNIEFIEHNVILPFNTDKKIDYIIHAAGIASPFYYRANPMETLDVAITGTKLMLELAKKNNAKFTFFSSSEIYGDPDPKHVPILESYRGNVSTMGPRSCYDESKRLGETLCYIYHEYFGVHTNIIRPFNIYGPGMQENDYRVLPNFASRIQQELPLNVYGRGTQTRTFCYITDAIVGFLSVISKGVIGNAYNIGNPKPEVSVNELTKVIANILNKKIDINIVDYPDSYPADEPLRRCPDINKARIQLNYEPVVDLEKGLNRFFSWTSKVYNKNYDK